MITAGIDLGSRNIKVVVLRDGGVLARQCAAGALVQAPTAERFLAEVLGAAGASRGALAHVTATGAGRKLAGFADSRVTEVSAAARGANHLYPGVTTVVEVGAEQSRGIKTDGAGRVIDAAVNEKCAAGSGSFTESMARALGMELPEFARKSVESTARIPMNAQCTVFAESEVVSLIHQGVAKRDIARAVNDAIAGRVATLVRRVKVEGEVVVLGGVGRNGGFLRALQENLGGGLLVPDAPEFADALGAALVAAERAA